MKIAKKGYAENCRLNLTIVNCVVNILIFGGNDEQGINHRKTKTSR